jgi:hypothetical protein
VGQIMAKGCPVIESMWVRFMDCTAKEIMWFRLWLRIVVMESL